MTTSQLADRKAIYRKIRGLSNSDASKVMEFIDRMHESGSDPFYGESNMRHLRAVREDALAGINMSVHELLEVDDD